MLKEWVFGLGEAEGGDRGAESLSWEWGEPRALEERKGGPSQSGMKMERKMGVVKDKLLLHFQVFPSRGNS